MFGYVKSRFASSVAISDPYKHPAGLQGSWAVGQVTGAGCIAIH